MLPSAGTVRQQHLFASEPPPASLRIAECLEVDLVLWVVRLGPRSEDLVVRERDALFADGDRGTLNEANAQPFALSAEGALVHGDAT